MKAFVIAHDRLSTPERVGDQLHPEVTAPLLESWCAVGGAKKLIEAGIDPEELIEETSRLAPVTVALAELLDWWPADYRPR